MLIMILGLALWTVAHFYRRVRPAQWQNAEARMGAMAVRGLFAIAILLSVVLMVIGYRTWFTGALFVSGHALNGIGALITFAGFVIFSSSHSKSRLRGRLRHPQLFGFALWALGHIVANGDWASIVLFGWLGIWALASITIINREGDTSVKADVALSTAGDIRLLLISLVASAIIIAIHIIGFGLF